MQYSKHFGDPTRTFVHTFLTRTLVYDHLMHNPNGQYFDFRVHKEMCILPEIFRPECSVRALLPEYTNRRQALMQRLTEAGYTYVFQPRITCCRKGFSSSLQLLDRQLLVFSLCHVAGASLSASMYVRTCQCIILRSSSRSTRVSTL